MLLFYDGEVSIIIGAGTKKVRVFRCGVMRVLRVLQGGHESFLALNIKSSCATKLLASDYMSQTCDSPA